MCIAKSTRFRFYKRVRLRDDRISLRLRGTVEASDSLGYVPSYLFDIYSLRDRAVVGRCDLRVGFNRNIYYAGNIGYSVSEQYRGNHYALSACFLLQELARRHGMRRLIVTCNPQNIASKRTCELFGAKYTETAELPHDHELFLLGERQKLIFIKEI